MFTERKTQSLDGEWQLFYGEGDIEASEISALERGGLEKIGGRVPGNFELDLQRAGIVDEPFHGMNIAKLRSYEQTHWHYARRFCIAEIPAGTVPYLVFEGVDCYATYYLNGEKIGESDNMLIDHRFAVPQLRIGENELVVHIRPTLAEAMKYDYTASMGTDNVHYPLLRVRKAAHMFGWDIMPYAVSAGLWRGVRIEFTPQERWKEMFLRTLAANAETAKMILTFDAALDPAGISRLEYEVRVEGRCGDSVFGKTEKMLFSAGRMRLELPQPRLWWPRGRGEAALYDMRVTLLRKGKVLDTAVFRHGIRTVELLRTSTTDEQGAGEFCFKVNGERVFMHGSNWVPADAYHSRDRSRLPLILPLVLDSGCNILRTWGGNVYEDDYFFNFCDENGVMVWQDFGLACGVYSNDDQFAAAMEREARFVVRRLRHHASIILWSGDNECDQASAWFSQNDPQQHRVTRKVFKEVLWANDRSRPYLPSSPYIDAEAAKVDERYLPENHLWGPRGYFKAPYYKKSLSHFASEIGYHGCPSPESIRRFISPDKLWPARGNPEWILHATSPIPGVDCCDYRIELMHQQIIALFGTVPDTLEEFSAQSQCVQAEAKKFFIELFRGAKWRRTGIIWWNLMDGWPQFSDAVVDYYFDKKLAYHYIKRAQSPLLAMMREPLADGTQELVLCNDRREAAEATCRLHDIETSETLWQGKVLAAGDAVTVCAAIPCDPAQQRCLGMEWESASGSGKNHYLAGPPPFSAEKYQAWMKRFYN